MTIFQSSSSSCVWFRIVIIRHTAGHEANCVVQCIARLLISYVFSGQLDRLVSLGQLQVWRDREPDKRMYDSWVRWGKKGKPRLHMRSVWPARCVSLQKNRVVLRRSHVLSMYHTVHTTIYYIRYWKLGGTVGMYNFLFGCTNLSIFLLLFPFGLFHATFSGLAIVCLIQPWVRMFNFRFLFNCVSVVIRLKYFG